MTTDPRTSSYLARLRTDRWTDIADGMQSKVGAWDWAAADNAPLTTTQAKTLYDKGLIEIAQRRLGIGRVVMVAIRRRQPVTDRVPWFGRFEYSKGQGPDAFAREMRRHA